MCKLLILFLQFTLLHQSSLCKDTRIAPIHDVAESKHFYEENVYNNLIPAEYYLDKRFISDIWISIKQTAKNVINSIKHLAQDTKEKIKIWIEHVKNEADRIREALGERIEILKTKLIAIIHSIFGEGEVIKKCLQNQSERLNKLLKDIVKDVTKCIGNKINSLSNLDKLQFPINDLEYVGKVEEKLNSCMEKEELVDECLQSVRKEIAEDTNVMENDILKQRLKSRSQSDDILDAIVTCSTAGLIEASAVITTEVLDIINCIVQGSLAHFH